MFLALILILLVPSLAFADRVLIRLSDGVPIEYQYGDADIGTLRKNHPEYQPSEVEERTISTAEYESLFEEKVIKPDRKTKEAKQKPKEDRLRQKLGLSESEWNELKEILR